MNDYIGSLIEAAVSGGGGNDGAADGGIGTAGSSGAAKGSNDGAANVNSGAMGSSGAANGRLSGLLSELRAYAAEHRVPILRPDSAQLLSTLTALKRPGRILEAGTAIGYSALLMAQAAPDAETTTVELDPDMVAEARHNIAQAGLEDRIRVVLGDATEVFAALGGGNNPPAAAGLYDMIFLDSAKGQYIRLLDDVTRLLRPGGLLIADNCIFYGKLLDAPAESPHKHRTIVTNMRAFLERVILGGEYRGTLVETGDGMLIAVKK